MKRSQLHRDYLDILNDNDFISWMLLPDDESDLYWDEYLKNNPELQDAFDTAVRIFSQIEAEGDRLTTTEKENLLLSIKEDAAKKKRRGMIRLWSQYAAAVSILLIISLSIFLSHKKTILSSESFIVGIEQESQDIQLITGGRHNLFDKNLQLQINIEGEIEVNKDNGEQLTVIKPVKEELNKLIVPYGKQSQLKLADGTRIWVNSGSVLSFPNKFQGDSRDIYLNGEIYLEVESNKTKPFIVHTSNAMSIQVYGTRFNVSNYDDSACEIVLVEGSIGLKKSGMTEMKMFPNDKVVYQNQSFEKESNVDVSKYITWKDNYLLFDNTPISDILKQIGRYYNVSFDVSNQEKLMGLTCTGKIYLSSDFKNVMRTISILSSTKYRLEGNNVYLELD